MWRKIPKAPRSAFAHTCEDAGLTRVYTKYDTSSPLPRPYKTPGGRTRAQSVKPFSDQVIGSNKKPYPLQKSNPVIISASFEGCHTHIRNMDKSWCAQICRPSFLMMTRAVRSAKPLVNPNKNNAGAGGGGHILANMGTLSNTRLQCCFGPLVNHTKRKKTSSTKAGYNWAVAIESQ